jgi:glutamate formiminotransferase
LGDLFECVINLSEGRNKGLIESISQSAGDWLLDVHIDDIHNRSVITLASVDIKEAALKLCDVALSSIDMRSHSGVHPRLGAIDVVPFVPLPLVGDPDLKRALKIRDQFAEQFSHLYKIPCFLYGPEISLPEIRRRAFRDLLPDYGPQNPHEKWGTTAVGARQGLIAYNVICKNLDIERAKELAKKLRSTSVRSMAFNYNGEIQLSFNLIRPFETNPADIVDEVKKHTAIKSTELVGLIPESVLEMIPEMRWEELNLSRDKTVEERLKLVLG